jgi:AcrR family transcriptional regulator
MSQEAVNSRPPQEGRVNRDDVITLAHRWFLDGRRVDIQALSRELGIGRATVYRWFSGREVVLGEVVWRILIDAITRVEARGGDVDADRFIHNFGLLAETVRNYEPLERFVSDEPEYALRVLTSRYSVVQGRLIDWTVATLGAMPGLSTQSDLRDLAYAIVRLGESFIWSDMITGDPPQPEKATAMVGLLIAGACATPAPPG